MVGSTRGCQLYCMFINSFSFSVSCTNEAGCFGRASSRSKGIHCCNWGREAAREPCWGMYFKLCAPKKRSQRSETSVQASAKWHSFLAVTLPVHMCIIWLKNYPCGSHYIIKMCRRVWRQTPCIHNLFWTDTSGQLHDPIALCPGKELLVSIGQKAGWSSEKVWTRWQ